MVNNVFGYNTDPDLNTTIGAGSIDIDENCAAANINNAIRTIMANIRDMLDDIGGANTSGGTATVQTLTTSGTLTALADGTILTWISGFDAGAGATLNVDSLGAKALLNNDGSAIAANDFASGQPMCAIYDASADSGSGAWLLVNISQKQIDAINTSIAALTGSDIANTPAGNIVATDVQAAIDELDGQDTTIIASIAALGSDDIADDSASGLTTVSDSLDAKMQWGFKNLLHNGGFQVDQRRAHVAITSVTTPANNDDTYGPDGVILLSDGNDIVDWGASTILLTGNNESPAGLHADVETANKKFGFLMPIEDWVCWQARRKGACSLQFKVRTGAAVTLSTVRAAVLEWGGTSDAITSDVVSAWNAAGADPTLVANWSYANTPSDITLTGTTPIDVQIENIPLNDPTTTTNLAVFIWVDDTDCTVDDRLIIGDVQLEVGTVCTAYEHRPYAVDLLLCRRYYWKGEISNSNSRRYGLSAWGGQDAGFLFFGTEMRATPTATILTAPSYENASNVGLNGDTSGVRITATPSSTNYYRAYSGVYEATAEL